MITVDKLAEIIGGTTIGNGAIKVKGMAPCSIAGEGDITFVLNESELDAAWKSAASCILTTLKIEDPPKTLLSVDDIKLAMTMLYNVMLEMTPPLSGAIHPSAVVAESAVISNGVRIGHNTVVGENVRIGNNSSIGANCVIANGSMIGDRSCIHSNVTVYENSIIGKKVIIHSGTVIGADGFGYMPKDGKIYKVPQMGNVVIEDHVELGANCCIDRGTFTTTVIGEGSKIDNLVQIAHNVKIGRGVMIAAQTGIAGSACVGDGTMMGGQSGVKDHTKIGNNVHIAAKSGVIDINVPDGSVLFGYPARAAKKQMKQIAFMGWLFKNAGKIRKIIKDHSK